MRIISWNVNGIRARLPRVLALLERHQPDVLCLQETKVQDPDFPHEALASSGYVATIHGQPSYNGVAILTREGSDPPHDPIIGFPDNPLPEDSRALSATIGDLRVLDLYVPNGREVGHAYYDLKLRWLDALTAWIDDSSSPATPLLLVGDFNIAPTDRDVHDPARWSGSNLVSQPERDRYQRLLDWGLTDLHRSIHLDGATDESELVSDSNPVAAGPFTWWDYRFGAFRRGWGLRIDLALATAPVAARCRRVWVDREERKTSTGEGKPSDHAPLVIDLD